MISVGIIGATGYTGGELLRLLLAHTQTNVTYVSSESQAGKTVTAVYPHLSAYTGLTLQTVNIDSIIDACDLIFIALPHGHAINIVPDLLAAGKKVIDLGADFRLKNPNDYEQWYHQKSAASSLLEQATYGLPELNNRAAIKQATLIANPGCYATAALIATHPALQANIIDKTNCIYDAKSGVSGAGRSPSIASLYCEVAENMNAYQIAGQHRHTPEIEQALSVIANQSIMVQFTPHVIPIIRGMLVTAYFRLTSCLSLEEVHALYQTTYQNEAFVHVCPIGTLPQIKHVRGTNHCHIGLAIDHRTNRLIIISVIDNLIKGACGQAIQNMNIMHDFPETMGLLNYTAIYP